jgi:uncharacterized protein YebE (UPF0316 family)
MLFQKCIYGVKIVFFDFFGALIIALFRILDVSLGTLRVILVVRGKRLLAAIIGFFEVMIFLVVLGKVVNNLHNIYNILGYCFGFATGTYLGSIIEEKMALGYVMIQIISVRKDEFLKDFFKKRGYPFTIIPGEGREGPHELIQIVLSRSELNFTIELVKRIDPKAFITIIETQRILGGVPYHSKRK